MPTVRISLHCHEFGVFYALARLKKLGVPVRTVSTLHATVPGRTAGYKALQKIAQNDSKMEPGTPLGFATMESLARYADVVTFVGDSTMKEAMLFYSLKGFVVRNGIDVETDDIDWTKKEQCRKKIQKFLADNLYKFCDGQCVDQANIIPLFTISRIEIENKGYPQLLDALVLQDHLLKHRIVGQRHAEDTRVVCFLIAAHGPKAKEKLTDGFPINLPPEILVGDEIRLENMIKERSLDESELISGKRKVAALLYPQWVGREDGGLGMTADEIMAGCIAGIFPSQYEPFLLTALEAGREGTPNIVSRAAGYSDALKKIKHRVPGLGGVIIVDNIEALQEETVLDYALAMDYFTWTFLEDEVKYRLLCEESFSLAKQFAWTDPVMEYYRNLVV
jgi:glycosyltransferase involved in cell wall biosynthesis